VTPPPAPRSGPSIGQAVVLFLAGVMLFSTTCFGIFGLEKAVPADLQPLVFLTPLLFIGAGVLVSVVAVVVAVLRAFTKTEPAATAPPAVTSEPVAIAAGAPAAMGRPSFAQALAIAAAGCVLFLSLCAGIVSGSNGRAGWISGPLLLALIGAALYGFGVMALRVVQSFGPPRR
jgi:hypothetical protein